MMGNLKRTLHHGLVRQRVKDRLDQIGVKFHPYYLIREGTKLDDMKRPRLAEQYRTALLTPEELPTFPGYRSWDTDEEFRNRLERENLCVVVWDDNRVAGFTWADLSEVNDRSCDFALGEQEAYLYDAYVAPEYRGKGLAPYLRYASYDILHDAGFRTFFSVSEYFNSPAIRFKLKLNAEIVRLYLEIKLGRHRLGQWVLKDYINDLQR